jgi:hypothetical protein
MKKIAKIADGRWWAEWNCSLCIDSGIVVGLLGPEPCMHCQARFLPLSVKVYEIIQTRRFREQEVDTGLLTMAQLLISAQADEPILGEGLAELMVVTEREVKKLAARLCDEWSLPVIATRRPPYGYFIAQNAEELMEWGRVTRSQAINMLARFYHLFKTNFPDLAGQESLPFVDQISSELQEAIR